MLVDIGGIISGSASGSEAITLSGTSPSPNTAYDLATDPSVADAGWAFNSNGTIDRLRGTLGDQNLNDGVEWCENNPPNNSYWIRFTEQSFSGDGTRLTNPGMGTWLSLGTTRTCEVDDPVGTGTTIWVVKAEIATDASGTNIVATGYFSMEAETQTP